MGQVGEDIACEYLVKSGYKIVSRNYRRKWGEIDTVAKYKDGTLVFFEVKTMLDMPGSLKPEDQATSSKLRKVRRACEEFAGSHPDLVNAKRGWRIDLLAVYAGAQSGPETGDYLLTKSNKDFLIRHYQNI